MPRPPATNRDKLKTERLSVLTTYSNKENLNKIAFMQRKAVNELLNDMIAAYISRHKADIQKYDQTFVTENSED